MLSRAAGISKRVQPPGYYGTGFTLQALGDAKADSWARSLAGDAGPSSGP
jgi:hypothetical protein